MIKDTAVQILLEHFSEGMVRTIVDAIAKEERNKCTKVMAEKAFAEGFYEGFKASGEGWNGEYPFMDNNLEVKNHKSIVEDLNEAWNKYISGDNNE